MSRTKVYIDGQSGTTGLQIHDRIEAREDLRLLRICDERRRDRDEAGGMAARVGDAPA